MKNTAFSLFFHAERFAIVQLAAHAPIPTWVTQGDIFSITRTKEELSLVCLESRIPKDMWQQEKEQHVKWQTGFIAIQVQGVLDFSLTGILASILIPLAQAKISIFAISTYNTDYIFIQEKNCEKATKVLKQAGYPIENIA